MATKKSETVDDHLKKMISDEIDKKITNVRDKDVAMLIELIDSSISKIVKLHLSQLLGEISDKMKER